MHLILIIQLTQNTLEFMVVRQQQFRLIILFLELALTILVLQTFNISGTGRKTSPHFSILFDNFIKI